MPASQGGVLEDAGGCLMFTYLNYLLTLMGLQRSKNNRRGLRNHLRDCDLDAPGDCRFCLRTVAMCK